MEDGAFESVKSAGGPDAATDVEGWKVGTLKTIEMTEAGDYAALK
jgi:hypothetical protein